MVLTSKDGTTKETASGYATTTREQAVAMSLRTYNSIK